VNAGRKNKNCRQNTEKLGADQVFMGVDSEHFVDLLRDPGAAIVWKPDQATSIDVPLCACVYRS
jgi:hypothetical protein